MMSKLIELVKNKYFKNIFLLILIVYLSTSLVGEWRTNAYIQNRNNENNQTYKAIIGNASRLTECYVEKPNQDYCFTVLGIISSQIDKSDYNTSGVRYIWFNTYIYIAAISMPGSKEGLERLVKIACNERLITKCERFIPIDTDKENQFLQALRSTYRTQINIQLSGYKNNDNRKTQITN